MRLQRKRQFFAVTNQGRPQDVKSSVCTDKHSDVNQGGTDLLEVFLENDYRMDGTDSGAVHYLLAAGGSRGGHKGWSDTGGGHSFPYGREQDGLADGQGSFVMLGLVAERAGHSAAA